MKFGPGTSVLQHVTEVSLKTVVGTSLDGDADTFGSALLRIPEAKQSPMKQQNSLETIANKITTFSRNNHHYNNNILLKDNK